MVQGAPQDCSVDATTSLLMAWVAPSLPARGSWQVSVLRQALSVEHQDAQSTAPRLDSQPARESDALHQAGFARR